MQYCCKIKTSFWIGNGLFGTIREIYSQPAQNVTWASGVLCNQASLLPGICNSPDPKLYSAVVFGRVMPVSSRNIVDGVEKMVDFHRRNIGKSPCIGECLSQSTLISSARIFRLESLFFLLCLFFFCFHVLQMPIFSGQKSHVARILLQVSSKHPAHQYSQHPMLPFSSSYLSIFKVLVDEFQRGFCFDDHYSSPKMECAKRLFIMGDKLGLGNEGYVAIMSSLERKSASKRNQIARDTGVHF